MEVKYKILYESSVALNDIPLLSSFWKKKVNFAILSKLTSKPDVFGKPLRYSLKNHRTLRVGDYRVIFRIEKSTVKIFMIRHRKEVYEIARKRLSNK